MTGVVAAYNPNASYAVSEVDVEYRREGGRVWLARVYRPQGEGPFPSLVEIHGGQWRLFDRLQNAFIDVRLAASGLVIAAVDFDSANDAPYPASMAQINYATRWLKLHAPELGGTAEALGGIGFSSGGHMAILQAMRPADRRYASIPFEAATGLDARLSYVVLGWPVIDPYSRYLFAQEIDRADLIESGRLYFGDEAAMREANPQLILERGERVELPPALIVQGAADAQLTPGMAERFVAAYSAAGGVIELGKYPGAPHGFAREDTANTSLAIAQIKSFIARQVGGVG
jgi:acetyl esterase